VTESGAEVFISSLSRDGRRLAYVLRRAGSERYELRAADVDTAQTELLDDDVRANVALRWSPDDTAVLHQRLRPVENHPERSEARLVRHEPGGRETVMFTWNDAIAFLPYDGTPDERELLGAIFHFSGASEIASWPVADGRLAEAGRVLFADPKASLWEPTYAPGRQWISFVRQPSQDADRLQLMIGPAAGGPPSTWTRIAADHESPDKPRWSAEGRLLYFTSRGSGAYVNLWAVPFDPHHGVPTGTPFQVTHYDSPTLFVSPHGGRTSMDIANGRVSLTMTSTTGSIWMLDDVEPAASSTAARGEATGR
jgi:hypothetical protein